MNHPEHEAVHPLSDERFAWGLRDLADKLEG
ncbi:hypothetical protein HDF15_002113 [Granulicella mallensis]|uniref:Uncharacterized protein n=1 Tax=Granulicella mallensis TaxID=940614 RepID=A0A7W8E8T1_9BACT|nr:hypothetical protein [Granulicella mallensis]